MRIASSIVPAQTLNRVEATRNRMLMAFLIGLGSWLGLSVAAHVATVYQLPILSFVCTLLSLGVWLVFLWALFLLSRLDRELRRNPEIRAVLHDERFRHNRLVAMAVGFWVVLALLGVVVGVAILLPLPLVPTAQTLLFAGVFTFGVASLWLDRRGCEAGERGDGGR